MARTSLTRGATSGRGTSLGGDLDYTNIDAPDWLSGLGPQFDALDVGKNIGQYYNAALSEQPGYQAILRNIAGQLSPAAIYAMKQGAAERGIGIGSYGGGNDATALFRAMGLGSQELTNLGLEQYRAAMAGVPQLSPTTQFVTPTDRANMLLNWQMQQERLAQAQAEAEAQRSLQEKLARWGIEESQSQFWGRLGAEERWAQANQAATEAYRNQVLQQAAANQPPLSTGYTPLGGYGTRQDFAPTAPSGAPVTPYWQMGGGLAPGERGYGGGSGSIWAGQNPGSEAAEASLLWGTTSPSDYGLEGVYQQGESAADYNAWLEADDWGYY